MPLTAPVLPLLATLHHQATKAVAALQKEIGQREKELLRLKAEAERWKGVVSAPARMPRVAASARAAAAQESRLDWSALLTELPAKFTLKELAEKANKPLHQTYIGVARWIKKVRKVKDGYQKVSAR
jgi:hypothetical protein